MGLQIIQEKDHDLMEVSHQADYAQMEVDALKDELVSLKSTKNMLLAFCNAKRTWAPFGLLRLQQIYIYIRIYA